MLREHEEAAPRQHCLYTCILSFRKTVAVRSLDADATFLYFCPSAGGPERLFTVQNRFSTHLTVSICFRTRSKQR